MNYYDRITGGTMMQTRALGVRVNATPQPKDGREHVERLTVQFIGEQESCIAVAVLPRAYWEQVLRPVLVAGAAAESVTLTMQE